MRDDLKIAWFAGLFEGEGTFRVNNGKCRGLSLASTDLDVLEKIKCYFGGNIFKENRDRPSHWKQVYIWNISNKESIPIIKEILPLLGKRRSEKAELYLSIQEKNKETFNKRNSRNEEIMRLFTEEKMSHQKIADRVGMDRSSITKLINKMVVIA